jgi:DtxR family Mn-dependent transcriptional regulator
MKQEIIDELLEKIWTMREKGRDSEAELLADPGNGVTNEDLKRSAEAGLARFDGGRVALTNEGEGRAERIIRRHRLAERLFHDLFDMEEEHYEQPACGFEHILSDEVTDSVCTFLGHPPHCPHGRKIPRGQCCMKITSELKPAVRKLTETEPGNPARIVFIVPKSKGLLDRLSVMGIMPGETVTLTQKSPSVVIRVGKTMVAVDKEIASEIYVK